MIRVVHTGSRIRILIFLSIPDPGVKKAPDPQHCHFFYYATNNKALATNHREMTHGGKSKVHCLQCFTTPPPQKKISRTKRGKNRKSRQFCMSLAIVLVADKLPFKQCTDRNRGTNERTWWGSGPWILLVWLYTCLYINNTSMR
jgi:hypothetical protein